MPGFGEQLRGYRQDCKDPHNSKQLTQERLGELLGTELGTFGYSGAAISDWENEKSKIHADERRSLVGLIRVLYKCGGLKTVLQADGLLEAGNYRALNPDEKRQIFPKEMVEAQEKANQPEEPMGVMAFLQERVSNSIDGRSLTARIAEAKDGPAASAWARKIVALMHWSSSGWTVYWSIRTLAWAWAWALSFWLISPSLHWPFPGQQDALSAMILYVAGAFSIPLLVGLLTSTKNDKFWQEHPSVSARTLRLYTYQGAGVGFHVAYAAIFVTNLFLYYLGFRPGLWFELIEMTFPLAVSYMSGCLVPYNMWRAYGRMNLGDGAIFFIFLIFGPVWGIFFYTYDAFLLDPTTGLVMILLAASLLVGMMAWQYYRTGTTVVPVYWWVVFFGFALVLYQISVAKDLLSVAGLAGIILTISTLLAFERILITTRGAVGLFIIPCLLWVVLLLNPWAGRILFGVIFLAWWGWGKKYLAFPPSFWGIIIAFAGCVWMRNQEWLSDLQASIVFCVVVALLLFWERQRNRPGLIV